MWTTTKCVFGLACLGVLALGVSALTLAGSSQAHGDVSRSASGSSTEREPQQLTVSSLVTRAPVIRDSYGVTSAPQLLWPVASTTAIADGFGARAAPCGGCSSYHEGVDFDPGNGTPARAIAAGVVTEVDDPSWSALGTHVSIHHTIDGIAVTSAYGHLQAGSMPLRLGDTVVAGQQIGRVGSTGLSTGPHLHFEIRVDGVGAVDPVGWLRARGAASP